MIDDRTMDSCAMREVNRSQCVDGNVHLHPHGLQRRYFGYTS